jgi:hypothetical protein
MRTRLAILIAVVVALTGFGHPVRAEEHRPDRDDERHESERPQQMRPVTFAAGWSNYADFYGDPQYEKVRFFKDASDVVHLQGLAARSAGDYWTTPAEADGSPIFVLPPGYRPSHRLIVVAAGNCEAGNTDADGKCRVDILPDGRVTVNDTLPSIISLTAITFRAKE